MTSLAGLDPAHRKDVLADLADAGVAVVVLPVTDMHLSGRADRVNVRRGIAPVRELLDARVRTGLSSNNVRNGFTPFGNTDVLDIALFLAQTSHLGGPEDFRRLIDMVTTGAAGIIGVAKDYGVRPGRIHGQEATVYQVRAGARLVTTEGRRPTEPRIGQHRANISITVHSHASSPNGSLTLLIGSVSRRYA